MYVSEAEPRLHLRPARMAGCGRAGRRRRFARASHGEEEHRPERDAGGADTEADGRDRAVAASSVELVLRARRANVPVALLVEVALAAHRGDAEACADRE